MNPRLLGFYLQTLENILPPLERAAYLNTGTRQTGVELTEARGHIIRARQALPGNTAKR